MAIYEEPLFGRNKNPPGQIPGVGDLDMNTFLGDPWLLPTAESEKKWKRNEKNCSFMHQRMTRRIHVRERCCLQMFQAASPEETWMVSFLWLFIYSLLSSDLLTRHGPFPDVKVNK